MSEYQRYEWMTVDRPLTREQLTEVNRLSSHIEATSTHALIEYEWGDFKHDPIAVLHEFFDGFLYWANWGAPELALRFPHGILPADLLEGYDLDDFVTLTQFPDYDILDIHFGELEGPDEWVEYELGSLIPLRAELMAGDLRSLYIVWLAGMRLLGSYEEDAGYDVDAPAVPPGMGTLTAAQYALAELLQVPQEMLRAAARHSGAETAPSHENLIARIKSLPPERQFEYLVRLVYSEPGLSYQLMRELREQSRPQEDPGSEGQPQAEHVPYATLLTESEDIRAQLEHEQRERERQERQRHIEEVHAHQDDYWQRADRAAARGSGVKSEIVCKLV